MVKDTKDTLHGCLARQLEQMEISVSEEKRERLVWFLQELWHWNRRINLTAITDPAEGVEKHLVDSLTLLTLVQGRETLLDIGSGGGFPGIPLKIVAPELKVRSLDAVRKKIDFQLHVKRRLALKGFEPVHGRAEVWAKREGWVGCFDVVTSRAFASLVAFGHLAFPFLAPGGRILALKGALGEKELQEQESALRAIGLVSVGTRRLVLPVSGAARTIVALTRVENG